MNNELIAGATFLKFKLDFRKSVRELNNNRFIFTDKDNTDKVVACYVARYNPRKKTVSWDTPLSSSDYSVLFFPQKKGYNTIMLNAINETEATLDRITSGILTKWNMEA